MIVIIRMGSVTALPTGPSLVCSLALSVLTFAAMQMFSEQLAGSQLGTIGGGFIGSLLFCFMLTVCHVMCNVFVTCTDSTGGRQCRNTCV